MPTDGTLLLEHMPKGKQYLVTALSVFFSIGAVLASLVALIVLPGHSCPPASSYCDVQTENQGWKYLLITLGLIVSFLVISQAFIIDTAFSIIRLSPCFLLASSFSACMNLRVTSCTPGVRKRPWCRCG